MKLFVACILAALAVSAHAGEKEEFQAFLIQLSTQCEADTGVGHDVIVAMKETQMIPEGADTDSVFNFCDCMLTKMMIRKSDGSIDVDFIKSKIPESMDASKVNPIIDECTNVPVDKTTSCRVIKCFAANKDKFEIL